MFLHSLLITRPTTTAAPRDRNRRARRVSYIPRMVGSQPRQPLVDWPSLPQRLPPTFRHRLALLMLLLVVSFSAPLYFYVNQVLSERVLADRAIALHVAGESIALALADNLHERANELKMLADATPLGSQQDLTATTRHLNQLQTSRQFYSWIALATPEGRVAAASQNLLLGADVHARPWFSQGLRAPYLGSVHEAVLLRRLLPAENAFAPLRFVDVAVPVRDARGDPSGVLVAHLNWRWAHATIQRLLPSGASNQGIEVLVFDREKRVLYPDSLFGSHINTQTGMTIAADGTGTAAQRGRGARGEGAENRFMSRLVSVPEPLPMQDLGWRVLIRQPSALALGDVRTLQHVVLASALAAGSLFLLVAWWAIGQISRPLENLVRYARQMENGVASLPPVPRSDSSEIEELNRAICGMAQALFLREQALQAANQTLEAEVRVRTDKLQRANAALEMLVERDPLTGLFNRRAANAHLHQEWLRLQRYGTPYVAVMIDIDLFKRVNDTFGHATGDSVLEQVAEALRASLREMDFVARFGGEEFLVLLPGTALEGGIHVADKLRQTVADLSLPRVGRITISVGVAEAQRLHTDQEAVIRQADARLYEAKRAGRNCVVARDAMAADAS